MMRPLTPSPGPWLSRIGLTRPQASTSLLRSLRLYASSAAVPQSTSPISPAPSSEAPVQDGADLRMQAIKLYKELHRLGRDYPDPDYGFNKRLRRAFEKNAKTTDPEVLKKQLELGEHIKKEVLALISLKKFRHLRRSYHPNEGPR